MSFSLLEKRYAVLCSFSSDVQDVGHAAIAISLDDALYMTVYNI